jgi:hypothetical protein
MSNKLYGNNDRIYIRAEDGSYRRLGRTETGGRYQTWVAPLSYNWEEESIRLPDTILKLLGEEDDL